MQNSVENSAAQVGSPESPPPHSKAVVVACAVAFLVFLGAVALLYWTWLPRQNPSAMIVVQGNAQVAGAEVTAEPIDVSSPPLVAVLKETDEYRLRFHVAPGLYRVTIRLNGHILIENSHVRAALMEPFFIRLGSPASRAAH